MFDDLKFPFLILQNIENHMALVQNKELDLPFQHGHILRVYAHIQAYKRYRSLYKVVLTSSPFHFNNSKIPEPGSIFTMAARIETEYSQLEKPSMLLNKFESEVTNTHLVSPRECRRRIILTVQLDLYEKVKHVKNNQLLSATLVQIII